MASASPRLTASAAITVVSVRTTVRAVSWREAAPAGQLDQQVDIVAVARVVLGVDQLEIGARLDLQPVALQPDVDDLRAPDQDRPGDAFLQHHLGGAQHALVLAVGIDDALGVVALADEKIGFITRPERKTKRFSRSM